MYSYKSLKDVSYNELVKCFNLAFSDYYLPLQLTMQELQTHFEASGVNKELSYGAFFENQMVGFIFNSCNTYNNQKVVFDVGTGVIPEHRGNRVFTNLLNFAEQELKKHQIVKYYLEVLQQNDKAISAYKKHGFTIIRELYGLKFSNKVKETDNTKAEYEDFEVKAEYEDFEVFDFNKIIHCNCIQPSYEHSTNVLKINPNFYSVAYRQKNNKISAFCIFSKEDGRVLQLGYTDICELKIIIQYLISKFGNIVVKNIDIFHSQVLEMFYSIGFTEVAKQFEMVKDLYSN